MILKKKYRHILVLASNEINAEASSNGIAAELLRFMGELAYSKANPRIVGQRSEKSFILKVNRGFEKDVILALSFVKKINNSKIGLFTIKTSGTIRALSARTEADGI